MVVTGAGGGIGLATCQASLAQGVPIIAVDVDDAALEQLHQLEPQNGIFDIRRCDVTDDRSVGELAAASQAQGPVRGLVNLAGTAGSAVGPAHELTVEEFSTIVDINLTGTFRVARAMLPNLRAAAPSAIVNVASVAGLVAFRNQSPYVASKHGVVGLTRGLALDYATEGISVNCVCPGLVDTPMMAHQEELLAEASPRARLERGVPVGRYSEPDEVARVITWLLLDAPDSMTGSMVTVDGGWTVK